MSETRTNKKQVEVRTTWKESVELKQSPENDNAVTRNVKEVDVLIYCTVDCLAFCTHEWNAHAGKLKDIYISENVRMLIVTVLQRFHSFTIVLLAECCHMSTSTNDDFNDLLQTKG